MYLGRIILQLTKAVIHSSLEAPKAFPIQNSYRTFVFVILYLNWAGRWVGLAPLVKRAFVLAGLRWLLAGLAGHAGLAGLVGLAVLARLGKLGKLVGATIF